MMTLTHLFDLVGQIWQAYRPLMPLRAARQLVTVGGHPGAALTAGDHWVVIVGVAVAGALLIGVASAVSALPGARAHRWAG